jgi:flagellar basal-body rod modification protein FlgD
MSTAAINPSTQAASAAAANSITSPANAIANQNTFLQLMISELENQDPTNPTDGTQFITQLATFSSVASQAQSATDLDSILALIQQAAAANAATNPAVATQGSTNGTSGN